MDEELARRVLVEQMNRATTRVLAGSGDSYDIALDAAGEFTGLLDSSSPPIMTSAYLLWIVASDLVDDPRGPGSARVCRRVALAFSEDWLSIETASLEAVDSFFDRWRPDGGTAWNHALPWVWRSSRGGAIRALRRMVRRRS